MSLKRKLALVWFVGLVGVEVMTGVGGAVVSMVQVKLAALLWLPAVSLASTAKRVAALTQGQRSSGARAGAECAAIELA